MSSRVHCYVNAREVKNDHFHIHSIARQKKKNWAQEGRNNRVDSKDGNTTARVKEQGKDPNCERDHTPSPRFHLLNHSCCCCPTSSQDHRSQNAREKNKEQFTPPHSIAQAKVRAHGFIRQVKQTDMIIHAPSAQKSGREEEEEVGGRAP